MWVLRALLLVALVLPSAAVAERRLALVIGNNDYENYNHLRKAVNDAQAVGTALKEIDFEVDVALNAPRRAMSRKLSDLETKVQKDDVVFIYYSGHGVSIAGENLLIPTDMPKIASGEGSIVKDDAFAIDGVIARMKSRGAKTVVFVSDACRENPFTAKGVRAVGAPRGLARMDNLPPGVLVLFSAGSGQLALDRLNDADTDPNSVYTRILLPLLREPGLTHIEIAKKLQEQVKKLALTVKHQQQPAYYDEIVGEITFKPGARKSVQSSDLQKAAFIAYLNDDPQAQASTEKYKIEDSESQIRDYDLNSDGLLDFIVLYNDTYHCGSGGCSSEVYLKKDESFEKVLDEFAISEMSVSSGTTRGMRDVEGIKYSVNNMNVYSIYRWNGTEYQLERFEFCGKVFRQYCSAKSTDGKTVIVPNRREDGMRQFEGINWAKVKFIDGADEHAQTFKPAAPSPESLVGALKNGEYFLFEFWKGESAFASTKSIKAAKNPAKRQ